MLFAEPSPAPTKAALSLLGRCSLDVRLPLVNASEKLTAELRTRIEGLAVTLASACSAPRAAWGARCSKLQRDVAITGGAVDRGESDAVGH